MIQRIHDWRLERRIQHLADQCLFANTSGQKEEARRLFHEMREAMGLRSKAQIERMEQARFRRLSPQDQRVFLNHKSS